MINFKKMQAGAIALSVMAFTLPACTNNDIAQVEEEANVTTEDLTENAESLVGQTVTIRSEVEEEVGEVGFIAEANELIGGEPILVLNATGIPFILPVDDDTPVQATGEVVQFIVADIETEYGLDLDPELYAEYEERPAIIAESLALAPEPGELAEDPSLYYDLPIAVQGEIDEVYSTNTFTIGEDNWFEGGELLVVGNVPAIEAVEGESVTVTGQLRPFVISEFERDYDLTWDLDIQEQIEAEYTEKPVLVADEVYPSAVEE